MCANSELAAVALRVRVDVDACVSHTTRAAHQLDETRQKNAYASINSRPGRFAAHLLHVQRHYVWSVAPQVRAHRRQPRVQVRRQLQPSLFDRRVHAFEKAMTFSKSVPTLAVMHISLTRFRGRTSSMSQPPPLAAIDFYPAAAPVAQLM